MNNTFQPVDLYAKKIWDYMLLNQTLQHSDIIIALGSSDVSIPVRAADVYHAGYADRILFVGGYGKVTKDLWHVPEADKFAEIAIEKRVPKDKIILENSSSNTGENIQFAKRLLADMNITIQSAIIICKPYKERRDYATFRKQWPEIEIIVTSPQVSYEQYMESIFSKDTAINLLVGDLQRMKVYEEKGYQIHQDIPDDVWRAYEELVKMGYDKDVIK